MVLTKSISCKVFNKINKDTAPFSGLILVGGSTQVHASGCLHLLLVDSEIREKPLLEEIADTLIAKIEMFSDSTVDSIVFRELTVSSSTAKARRRG